MRDLSVTLPILGLLLLVTGAAMLLPLGCALLYGEADVLALAATSATCIVLGGLLRLGFATDAQLEPRHAALVATLGWVVVSAVSAIPFMVHGAIPSFTDAFFEMMSGYTTTGSTILSDIETLPHGLLLWRSQTHLLGGMGFITLAVILLPSGVGGMRLFRAESSPGQVITRERFTPRTRDAMIWLWGIYLALNATQTALLWLGGMSTFDALCHSFGTVSTSGFSTYNASLGHFNSAYVDWVTIVFMTLGGMSFVLLFRVLHGDWRAVRNNTELRWYAGFLVALCGAASGVLWWQANYSVADALRFGTFQVVSLLTTTGFTTADYELWPHTTQMVLLVACVVGACAGSTTSGIKVVHYAVGFKYLAGAIKKMFLQPLAVVSVRLDGRRVDRSVIDLALAYFVVNVVLVLFGGCVLTLTDDLDIASAMSAVVATLMNIGPGWLEVGPSTTFAGISDAGKWFLSANMLVGRLEMFSALVLLYPSFWRS